MPRLIHYSAQIFLAMSEINCPHARHLVGRADQSGELSIHLLSVGTHQPTARDRVLTNELIRALFA